MGFLKRIREWITGKNERILGQSDNGLERKVYFRRVNPKSTLIAKANNEFGLKLFKEIAENCNENIFISPLSISIAFGMLYAGAMGSTAQELRNVLEYDQHLDKESVQKQFQKVLNLKSSKDGGNYVLYFANKIIISKEFKILESYENILDNYYDASIYLADFKNHDKEVVKYINKWVKTQTRGRIKEILKDDLPQDTDLVLINTIYFKGKWKTPFDKRFTEKEIFYGYDNELNTEFMFKLSLFNYVYSNTLKSQILELPYDGNQISLIIILPEERNGLKFLKDNLNLSNLSNQLRSMKETEVAVKIPKFKFSTSYQSFQEYLIALGMEEVFGCKSDLSGIVSLRDDEYLKVSQVIHKAIIEVNEEGTEAAAVTVNFGFVCCLSASYEPPTQCFYAEHPFAFIIRDNNNGLILFAGHVVNVD